MEREREKWKKRMTMIATTTFYWNVNCVFFFWYRSNNLYYIEINTRKQGLVCPKIIGDSEMCLLFNEKKKFIVFFTLNII